MTKSCAGGQIYLSAFGIHTGGGLILLKALLSQLAEKLSGAVLDVRLPNNVMKDIKGFTQLVPRSFIARLRSVNKLAQLCKSEDTLFCFNSLPPIQKCDGRVIVYIQSSHFVSLHSGIRYDPISHLRFFIERLWFRVGAKNVDEFWVQTQSMRQMLLACCPLAKVRILPFVDDELSRILQSHSVLREEARLPSATYFYPADGVGHKNHVVLLQAWEFLGMKYGEFCPRLVLTLTPQSLSRVVKLAGLSSLRSHIINLGPLTREQVFQQLQVSSALIFPSRAESFGLPLLEAMAACKPILASERDFIRDVCTPSQTFDPESSKSIALAVERHLGVEQTFSRYLSAAEIVEVIVMNKNF